MPGPLNGIRVIEMAAIGPVPLCGLLLADMGAEVIRVDRVGGTNPLGDLVDVCGRGKKSIGIDLKTDEGVALMLRLMASADVFLEGFRPGVAERLGIGPAAAESANPGLVYGRMTGWGQTGPMAAMAGHDINYIGLVGVLHAIGGEVPVVPLNLIGDYGGGSLFLALGVLAALNERQTSGHGQVVDAAMIDGAASLMSPTYQLASSGHWTDQRASNLLDGGAPFYRTYETADGGHMAVGALEPQFYAELLRLLNIEPDELPSQYDREGWHQIGERFDMAFRAESRQHWENIFSGTDACVTPVLSMQEAPRHVHNAARSTFVNMAGGADPAPAPRFSRTPASRGGNPPVPGAESREVLMSLGFGESEVVDLAQAGVIAGGTP